jgi:hypothetical protein
MSHGRSVSLVVAAVMLAAASVAAHHTGVHPACFSEPPPRNSEGPPEVDGFWEPLVNIGEQAIHAIHLPLSGKILVWAYNGGATGGISGTGGAVYDPATGVVTPISIPKPVFCAGHTHLADGRILIAGGQGARGGGQSMTLDPFTMTFSAPSDLHSIRFYPTLTLLDDGRVFTNSGRGARSNIPEIYDPETNTWSQFGCVTNPISGRPDCTAVKKKIHFYPRTIQSPDGSLFFAPASRTLYAYTLDLEGSGLYTEHAIGTATGGKLTPAPGVYYAPGRLLRAGTDVYAPAPNATADASIIDVSDPQNPTYRTITPMYYARNRNDMLLLADGTVLVSGGIRDAPCHPSENDPHVYHPELWDPATEQWTVLGPMQAHRVYHATTILLRDGSVLSAGGEPRQKTSQIFRPPYLFWGPRPVITAAPAEVEYGTTFEVETPDAASIAHVNALKLGAVTHAYNQSQHLARLSFIAGVDRLTVSAPADGYEAPPGYYLLFLISNQGVPSVAEYVQFKPGDPPW